MLKKSRLRLLVAAGILVVIGVWWYRSHQTNSGPLTLQGNVEVRQVNLGFKVAGRIAKELVDEGDTVKEGQVLASLEKIYFEDTIAQMRAQRDQMAANYAKLKAGNRPEEIAQARALVAEREAMLANARITFERSKQLLNTPAGSQKVYDDASAAMRQADAQLNSVRETLRLQEIGFRKEDIDLARAQLGERDANLKVAERQLSDSDLIAPNNGTILSRVREQGAIVGVGDAVYVLSLTSPVWVRTYVAEPDLARIVPGAAVDVKTDLPGGKVFKGRIGFVSTTAEFTPKTVETTELRTALVYRLRVVVDGDVKELRQGMPVSVIVSEKLEDAKVAQNAPKL